MLTHGRRVARVSGLDTLASEGAGGVILDTLASFLPRRQQVTSKAGSSCRPGAGGQWWCTRSCLARGAAVWHLAEPSLAAHQRSGMRSGGIHSKDKDESRHC